MEDATEVLEGRQHRGKMRKDVRYVCVRCETLNDLFSEHLSNVSSVVGTVVDIAEIRMKEKFKNLCFREVSW